MDVELLLTGMTWWQLRPPPAVRRRSPYVCLSVCPSVRPSVRLSVCLSVCLRVCPLYKQADMSHPGVCGSLPPPCLATLAFTCYAFSLFLLRKVTQIKQFAVRPGRLPAVCHALHIVYRKTNTKY